MGWCLLIAVLSVPISEAIPRMGTSSWVPPELITTIRSNGMDPNSLYYVLEAMKHKTPADTKKLMDETEIRPNMIVDLLEKLSMDIFDVYYMLRKWVGERLTDNRSSDPTFHKLSLFEAFRAMQLMKYTGEEINEEFNIIFLRGLQTTVKPLLNVNVYKLMEHFFENDKFYTNWKSLFPNAFRALKRLYDSKMSWSPPYGVAMFTTPKLPVTTVNPCCQGLGHEIADEVCCQGVGHTTERNYNLPPGYSVIDPKPQTTQPPPYKQDQYDLHDIKYSDETRYFPLQDEMHVYNKLRDAKDDTPIQTIHHVKRYYDKVDKIVIESSKTIQHHHLDNGSYRKVRTDITKYDPNEEPGRGYMAKYNEAQGNIP